MPFSLISVYDKTGIENLCLELINHGYHIIATSSTAKYLKEKEFYVKEILI